MGGRIPEHIIDEVRSRADIVEVIGSYIPLQKSGSAYKALCPFHKEKSPSFSVNQDRQIFHCFGCGEGGNVFSFLMKYDNQSFPEAVRSVADRYGVTIPENKKESAQSSFHARILAINETSALFYTARLSESDDNSQVTSYLRKRKINDDTAKDFRLGFAPDGWENLCKHLREQGYNDQEIEKSGLGSISRKGTLIDRFRNRLMFPISDITGRVIGFGGRDLGNDEKSAKYINSAESPVYDKSAVLYGISFAKKEVRKTGQLIVVEGYLDLLSLVQAGVGNVAAVSGTALTEKHAGLIARLAKEVLLLLDSDDAGINAAIRSAPILAGKGVQVKTLILKGAKDPDEFLQKFGVDKLQTVLRSAPSHPKFMLDSIMAKHDTESVDGKVSAVREGAKYISTLNNPIEKEQYAGYLARISGSSIRSILSQKPASTRGSQRIDENGANKPVRVRLDATQKAEKIILGILLSHPEQVEKLAVELSPEDFVNPLFRSLYETIGSFGAKVTAPAIIDNIDDDAMRRCVAQIVNDEILFSKDHIEATIKGCIKDMKYRRPDLKQELREEMKRAAIEGDTEAYRVADEKYRAIIKKISG